MKMGSEVRKIENTKHIQIRLDHKFSGKTTFSWYVLFNGLSLLSILSLSIYIGTRPVNKPHYNNHMFNKICMYFVWYKTSSSAASTSITFIHHVYSLYFVLLVLAGSSFLNFILFRLLRLHKKWRKYVYVSEYVIRGSVKYKKCIRKKKHYSFS